MRTLIRRDFAQAFESCDLLLTPTSPTVAFRIGELVDDPLAMYACDLFTLPVNLSGLPGDLASLRAFRGPAGRAPAGRPGLQREPPAGGRARARGRARVRPAPAGADGRGMSVPEGWEAVIGLEIHVQLSTRSKMFCRCPNESGGEPNTRICPVCTAQPGVLPVANRAAVERTIAVGLALELRDRVALDVPPQELLLSRLAQGVPDQPVRRTAVQRRPAGGAHGRRRRRRGLRARAPRGGRRQDGARGRRRRAPGRLARRRRRLQPLRHAADGDGHAARPAHARAGIALRVVPARDDRGARRLGMRHGEGLAARRRQRQPAAPGRGRAAHQDRAQEHELLQLPRARHRARAAAPGRAVRGRRGRRHA